MSKSKKFSSLLLVGKAATLPFLIQQARADVSLSYSDVLSSTLQQIQLPVSGTVQLSSLGTAPYSYTDMYGTHSYSSNGGATVCTSSSGYPVGYGTSGDSVSVVLTGLKDGDTLILATASSLGGLESYHSDIKLGASNLKIHAYVPINAAPNGTATLSIPIKLSDLSDAGYGMTQGSTFYMQSIVFPSGSVNVQGLQWATAKLSEVDVISIASCSTYGSSYGSTY